MADSSPCPPRPHENPHATLVLTRGDVAALMTAADGLACAREAFLALSQGRAVSPPPLHLEGERGALHAKGATLRTRGGDMFAAVKVNANFPGNRERHGLPTIQGAVLLFDGRNGRLLAILDSIEVTLRRTAAATALAATFLARPNARTVALIGCGSQALPHIEALTAATGARAIRAYDADRQAAQNLADLASRTLQLTIAPEHDLEKVVRGADIIVACTTARTPFLDLRHVAPGAFVAAVGADAPDKSELAPALMARAKVVCDVRAQCAAMGDLHHAIKAGVMTEKDVHADLAELAGGKKPGREHAREITIFDSTGTGAQDAAACAFLYEKAVGQGAGTPLRLSTSSKEA